MPLNIFMRVGDEVHIDDDIKIRWDPMVGKGRRIRLIISGHGHHIRLEKREQNIPADSHGDVDGNR